MRKVLPLVIGALLFMSSCSPSSVELTATANIALQQTQTAAPTKTPTPTLTPTMTATLTPTITPTQLGGGGLIAFVADKNGAGLIAFYNISTHTKSYPKIQFTEEVGSTFGVQDVSVSPAGTKLAFTQSICPVRQPGQKFLFCQRDLFISNIDGSNVVRLTHTREPEDWPAWSPDGTRIAYVSDDQGFGDIYIVNVDGTGKKRLTDAPGYDFYPTWSPDGKKIAFAAQRIGDHKIYVMNADGSGDVIQLTNIKSTRCYLPSWSPDGLKIAFVVYSNKNNIGDIYIMDADGGNQINLTAGRYSSEIGGPTWSPDGKMLAFNCNASVCIMYPDGTGITELKGLYGIDSLSWFLP